MTNIQSKHKVHNFQILSCNFTGHLFDYKIMKPYSLIFSYIVLFLLCVPALLPLFHAGFFSMHDDAQVQRTYEMAKALHDGMFPVRWSADLGYGYGYPLFNYYAPFVYYLSACLTFLGFSYVTATKIMIGIGIVLSGVGMYVLAKRLFGLFAGFVAASLYIYAPYHALDIYVRGDMAEAFAYSLLPFIFYFLLRIKDKRKWLGTFLGSVTYAALITSHNLTAFMVTPAIFIVAIYQSIIAWKKHDRLTVYATIILVLVGIFLASFYWLPALTEMSYTNVVSITKGGSDFHEHFVCLSQLWNSPWGFGGSAPGCIDGLSFRIGKVHVLATVIALVLLTGFLFSKDKKEIVKRNFFFLGIYIGLLCSFVLTLEISLPIWNAFKFMAYFQFPWRFLLLIAFFSSLCGGLCIWLVQLLLLRYRYMRFILASGTIVLVSGILLFNAKLFKPQMFYTVNDQYYINPTNLLWTTSNRSDEYMPKDFKTPKTLANALASHILSTGSLYSISSIKQTTEELHITLTTPKPEKVLFHIAPFPAWSAFVNDQPVPVVPTRQGYLLSLGQGIQSIRFSFTSTILEKVANILTLTSVVLLLIAIMFLRRKEKIHAKKSNSRDYDTSL